MATRSSSSSSSSSSDNEIRSGRIRNVSETSRETRQTGSHIRAASPTNTIEGTSIADTTTLRSASPTASHTSAAVSRTTYDTVSIATTMQSGATNATANSAQQQSATAGGIPIIRPPVLQQQQLSGTGVGVFGPQVPGGYPPQPPTIATNTANQQGIRIDVAAAQQQYQQRNIQPEVSPYSSSSVSSSGGSLSSPGNASIQQQQPRFDAAKAMFTQVDANKDGSISRQEFQQWAQGGMNQSRGQSYQQQQQAQFANQIPAHEVYNELLGPDAFKDVILDIDYGALGAFNVPFHTGGEFSGGQLPPGINVRSAYTAVDSLHYQQHMFNTARTVSAGGESNNYDYSGASNSYDYGASSNAYNYNDAQQYNVGGGQQFDVVKAMFNQADSNRDGGISREEFQNWTQVGQQNYGTQTYSNSASYGDTNNSLYQASLFAGTDPSVANILQQSGLGQIVPN